MYFLLPAWGQSQAEELARVLREKHVITDAEFHRVVSAGPSGALAQLTAILRDKGVLTPAEAASVNAGAAPRTTTARTATAPRPATAAQTRAPADPGSNAARQLHFYGTLLFNAFFNDQSTNNIDIPLFATQRTPGPQENFGATARQTRLGLNFSGPTVAGAKVSGTAEVDFLGGIPAFANGVSMDLVRMRLAYGRLDWSHFSLEAGQDWVIFAPINPTSFAAYAIPEFSASGNLWIRTPQLRIEWKHNMRKHRTFLWQFAALDPNVGDDPITFVAARQPHAGELGRAPAFETRLAFSAPIEDRTLTVGISGHWNNAKNTVLTNNIAHTLDFQSWGAAVDFTLPFSKYVNISGEAFAGRALGIFSGGIAQTYFPVDGPGANGVGTRGGWMQLQLNFSKKWQSNTAYGIDIPEVQNLITGARSKNQSYMSNIMFHLSPNVVFALEYHRLLTNYQNQPFFNNINDHYNLAAAYMF